MNRSVRVWPEEKILHSGAVKRTLVAEYFDGDRQVAKKDAFFELTCPNAGQSLPTFDWALLSVLFGAMRWKRTIRVEGPVSRRLMQNLEDFQMAFSAWFDHFTAVELTAQSEITSPGKKDGDRAVIAFSGGVDACFSAYRHIFKRPGVRHWNLQTAMLVHGFDLPLDKPEAFQIAYDGAQRILADTGVNLAVMRTNVRALLPQGWSYTYVSVLAACLHQFGYEHAVGLIGSDEPYQHLVLPWGSNPVTNPLLSSDAFEIVTDATGYTRTEKVRHVANWPAALNDLRVCWQGPKTGKNCGRCEKCVRTILNFRAVGAKLPPAFASDIDDTQIAQIACKNEIQRTFLKDILKTARESGIRDSWVEALASAVEEKPEPPKKSEPPKKPAALKKAPAPKPPKSQVVRMWRAAKRRIKRLSLLGAEKKAG